MSRVLLVLPLIGLLLAGCSNRLSEQSYVGLAMASTLPEAISHTRDDPGYLVITLSTDEPLGGDHINALYARGSFCPYQQNERQMYMAGPLTDEDRPKKLPRAEHRPIADGAYRYRIYVPTQGTSQNEWPAKTGAVESYDLASPGGDLCVKLTRSGPPKAGLSNVVRIPQADILAAMAGK